MVMRLYKITFIAFVVSLNLLSPEIVNAQDYLAFATRQFIYRLELGSYSLRTLYNDIGGNFIAFDYDYRRNLQYWTDVVPGPAGSIYKSSLDGGGFTTVISVSLDAPNGLAIDWLTNKLYWTEATPRTISVLDLDSGHRLTLFTLPESSIPKGIALDPANGYMFWTDWGSPGKVERAYMDGTGRITIANTDLVWPNDITIDYESQTLYWVDASLDKVESAGYDGSNRQLLVSSGPGVYHPFSITFFDGTLYWTDWQDLVITANSLESNMLNIVFSGLSTQPTGIEAISASRQEIVSTPCDTANGNCEQLCLLSAGRTAMCACVNGYTLASDGRTCETPAYLGFANRFYIHRLDLNTFSLQTLLTDFTENYIAFDYDYRRKYQYWTETATTPTSSIYRSNLQGEDLHPIISGSLDVPDGLAIDWLTNKLYWTEANPETISVLDLERGHRLTLFTLPESSIPRGIALDPANGYMFWTDWGSPGKVERAYMDGTSRITIADTNLVWPNDITIDYESQTLYWIDANLDKVESAGYDGSNRQLLVSSGVFHPFSITFYDGTLYWTDWQVDAVYAMAVGPNNPSIVFSGLITEPMGIEAISQNRQEIVSTPCDTANGNCEQLCLLSAGRTATCACVNGYTLTSDGRTCTAVQDYLAFANRQFIQRLELGSYSLRTLYSDVTRNFIAFDYDYRRDFMYWTDVSSGSIFKSNLEGGRVTSVISGSLQVPDGLAIDWLTNKLYWTEATPDTISVLDLERGHRLTLFTLPQSSIPRGIALDPANGYMFWTDWGSPGKVERAYMDGTGRITIADTNLVWPNDITIDYESQTLYWLDANLDKVESAGYDGSNRQLLLSSGVLHPFSITFHENALYWTDWQSDAVYMKTTGSSTASIVYNRLSTEPMGIEAVSTSRQRLVSTPCDTANGNCDQLCLLSAGRAATCHCVEGYTLDSDGRTCNGITSTTVTPPSPTTPIPGSCRSAGFTDCCLGGDCQGVPPRTCFCDISCVIQQDCCEDFSLICTAYTCSSLLSIPNGAITYSQEIASRYDIGTTAIYSCSSGFYLSGGSTRSCTRSGTMGVWDGSVPQCLEIICSTLTAPTNGLVSYNPEMTAPYEFGTTATYICTTGFGLFGGNGTRECVVSSLGGGGWSGTTPTCGSITCPNLSPPSNGQVAFIAGPPFIYGTIATFSCDEGYTINVSIPRTCGGEGSSTSGVWSGEPPSCSVISCPDLMFPTNGLIAFSSTPPYSFGTVATYSCVSGFGLSEGGAATRTCRGDGSSQIGVWTGNVPPVSCGAITCPSLGPINNGVMVYSPTTTSPFDFETTAAYTCNEGFFLEGERILTCVGDGLSVNGVWSDPAPVCAAVMCLVLLYPENGLITYSEDSVPNAGFMEMATYSCNPGFGLSGGDPVRTCVGAAASSGEWTGTAPYCRAITCSALSPPTDGQVSFSTDTTPPHFFGTVAMFTCAAGFALRGDTTRMCEGDGTSTSGVWSGSSPTCSAYMCSALPLISNGVISYSPDSTSPFEYGTMATYSCNNGFYLMEMPVRSCSGAGSLLQGYWLGQEPECAAIVCTSLAPPTNGFISYGPDTTSPYDYQTTATYGCNEGYGLFGGDRARQCESSSPGDGGWSGTTPTCEIVTCPSLSPPTNGRVTFSSASPYSSGTMASFSCNEGYGLSDGDGMLTCGGDDSSPNGAWSGVVPTCEVITCNTLVFPTNGMIAFSPTLPYSFGTVATYSCVSGFGLSGGGGATRTCRGDGSSHNGVWSGPAVSCGAIICPSLGINNGVITYSPTTTSSINFGATATYTCNEGFYLTGSTAQTCGGDGSSVDGSWSGAPPVCAAVMCPVLTYPENSVIIYSEDSSSSLQFMEMATYSCSPGFGLSGGDTVRTCVGAAGSSGEWTGTAPTCQAITCPPLSPPSSGGVSYSTVLESDTDSSYSYGTVATFTCITGYGVNGDTTITCVGDGASPNGEWNGFSPTCLAYTCTMLPPFPNGVITYDPDRSNPFQFGTTASFFCNEGFYVSQSSIRICTGSGATSYWEGEQPECIAIMCTSLAPQTNGLISFGPDTTSPYDYQTTATYVCIEGYGLFGGDRTRQCNPGSANIGQWSGIAPMCETITCPAQSPPINGRVDFSTDFLLTHGTMATFSCDEGYGLSVGDMVTTCRGDGSDPFGTWIGVVPACEPITCSPLSSITNGDIVYSPDTTTIFTFSTTATYSCNEGFLLLGNNEQICSGGGSSVNGLWSGSTPVCTAFSCLKLSPPQSGVITYSENTMGFVSTATYSCSIGFGLSGGDTVRTCIGAAGSFGKWNGTTPSCQTVPVVVSEQTAIIGGSVGGLLVIAIVGFLVLVVLVVLIVFKRRKGNDDFRPQRFNNDPEGVNDNSYEPVVAKLNGNIQDEGHVMVVANPLYGQDSYENDTKYSQHDLDYDCPIDKQYYDDEVIDSSKEDFDDPMENGDHVSDTDSEVIARRDYENSNPVYADDITLIN